MHANSTPSSLLYLALFLQVTSWNLAPCNCQSLPSQHNLLPGSVHTSPARLRETLKHQFRLWTTQPPPVLQAQNDANVLHLALLSPSPVPVERHSWMLSGIGPHAWSVFLFLGCLLKRARMLWVNWCIDTIRNKLCK